MLPKRKKYIISFIIFVMLVLMLNVVNANSIKVEQTKLSSGGAEINVHSDNKVREVRFYKKVSDKWILFYTNLESGYNNKKFFISRYKLSTSEGSKIKVVVVDENGEEQSNVADVSKVPEQPTPSSSPSSSPTSTPSSSPTSSVTPSTEPSPSVSPSVSPSPSASVSPSSKPSTSPSSSPSNSNVAVKSITLNNTSLTMTAGATKQLVKTITPSNAKTTLKWSTNNSKVATVDANGKVTAKAKGTATITVTTANGKKATCKVTVRDASGYTTKLNGHTVKLPAGNDRIYILDTQDFDATQKKVRASDAIVFESNGKYAMIDTSFNFQADRVIKYLNDIGVDELEFILLTHMHGDHIGGFKKILNSGIKVKKLYIKDLSNSKSEGTNNYARMIKNAQKKNVPICFVSKAENKKFSCGDFKFSLYNTGDNLKSESGNENVNSVTALVTIHGKKCYFSGDIVNDKKLHINAETKAANSVGQVFFYKAAHHSYSPNNSVSAMKKLNPQYGAVTNLKHHTGTDEARSRILNNSRINDSRLKYSENGTLIYTFTSTGELKYNKLGNDGRRQKGT